VRISASAQFALTVLAPTLRAYRIAERGSRVSEEAVRQLHLGMLACWHLLTLFAKERQEPLGETFKLEALRCSKLHVVRAWVLCEEPVTYPRWVKPRPRPGEPIDMGYCFVMAANHLVARAGAAAQE
jgi:hypothetical protein